LPHIPRKPCLSYFDRPEQETALERAFAVSTPQGEAGGHQIYFAGDVIEVVLNARMWNEQVATPEGRRLWGRRRIQYFVYVPHSGQFAPSKFCAFLPVGGPAGPERSWHMTLGVYAALDESETRFDGNVAHRHLTQRLGMVTTGPASHPRIAEAFRRWPGPSLSGVVAVVEKVSLSCLSNDHRMIDAPVPHVLGSLGDRYVKEKTGLGPNVLRAH
jgi:hypothetical protein